MATELSKGMFFSFLFCDVFNLLIFFVDLDHLTEGQLVERIKLIENWSYDLGCKEGMLFINKKKEYSFKDT